MQVTPKSASAFGDGFILRGFEGSAPCPRWTVTLPMPSHAHAGKGFGSVEFLNLTPGLGRYFGTEQGLLVVHAPADERLKLQEGDVVLDIDGRVPNNASHAFRIFSSYRSGETLKLHIMRDQKRMELPIDVPADTSRLRSVESEFRIALPRAIGVVQKGIGDRRESPRRSTMS